MIEVRKWVRKLLGTLPRERRDPEKRAVWSRQEEIERRIKLVQREIDELKR